MTAILQQERTRRIEAEQQASEMRTQLRQLQRQLLAARDWPGEQARERLYLHLLWAAWLQMRAPSARVAAA